jgi:uncharacterized membrane protein
MRLDPTAQRPVELRDNERLISAVAGGLLLYFLTRKHRAQTLLMAGGGYLLYRGLTGRCPLSSALQSARRAGHAHNINVRTQLVVNRPRSEVYTFWRRLENWPMFMRHLENIDEIDSLTSAWRLKMPGMGDIRWEVRLVKDEKNREISWHSVPGAPIECAGKINFSDTPGNATRIDVLFSYRAPLGAIGERLGRLLTPVFRDKIEEDIHNFKRHMENTATAM